MGDLNLGFAVIVIAKTNTTQRRPDQTGVVNFVFDQQDTQRTRRHYGIDLGCRSWGLFI
jgi:hypothetical protein